jgi:drug/metabolite transporter (DMT)-like permease
MSKRGLLLFIGSSIVGGLPWIFTKILLEKFEPSGIVLIRALVAGLVMLMYSLQQKTLLAALKKWPWILVFALIQMTIPWWLTGYAQKTIDTTVVGLLMATIPIFALLFAFVEREHSAITGSRIAGVITGLIGVAFLIGIDAAIGKSEISKVLLVVLCTMGFAYGPRLVRRHLSEVPTSGVLAIAMIFTAAIWLIPAASNWPPGVLHTKYVVAALAVSLLCTAIGFIIYLEAIKEIGPQNIALLAFTNPIVSISVGVLFAHESISLGLIVGFPIIMLGIYLSTSKKLSTQPLPI